MKTLKTSLLNKLQHYCAYQDRCHFEVQQKLNKLGADPETAGAIFIQLIEEGFLNEERFARSIARGKFRIHHWGKIKIIDHLRSRGISDVLIQISLTEIEEEEYLGQLQLQGKKIYQGKKDLNRTIQALIAKGFETELVYEHSSNYSSQAVAF
jgi:regulatory protein